MLKSKPFPFKRNHKIGTDVQYPEGSLIYKEILGSDAVSIIEYDTLGILKTLKGTPTESFSDLPHLSEEQMNTLLRVISKNIVEISFKQ